MVKKMALGVLKTTIGCLFYCAVVMATIYACLGCYRFGFQIFSNPVYDKNATTSKTIEVASLDKEVDVAKHLQESGVIEDYRVAYIRLQFSEYKDKIQPGTYQVSGSMPLDEVLATLSCMTESDVKESGGQTVKIESNDSGELSDSESDDKSNDKPDSDNSEQIDDED